MGDITYNNVIRNGAASTLLQTPSDSNWVMRSDYEYASGESSLASLDRMEAALNQNIQSQTTSDTVAPTGLGSAAQIVYAAITPYKRHSIGQIDWSYNSTPVASGSYLQVESPSGTVIWGPHYITTSGPGFFPFQDETYEEKSHGLVGEAGAAMLISLTSGGGMCKASLSVTGHKVV